MSRLGTVLMGVVLVCLAACELRLDPPLSEDDLTPSCGHISREVLVLFESSTAMQLKPTVEACPDGWPGLVCRIRAPTKLAIAGEALQSAVNEFAGQLGVGVLVYPNSALPDLPHHPVKSAACKVRFIGKVFDQWCAERAPTTSSRCAVDEQPQRLIGAAYEGIEFGIQAEGEAPLAEALAVAYTYFLDRPAIGRMRNVVVITDGADTCGGEPAAAIQQLRHLNVNVWFAGFEGIADPQLDALAARSRNTRDQSSWRYFSVQSGGLREIMSQIATTPIDEVCDGVDNDCDGSVDEGLVRDCDAACGGVQVCQSGEWRACVPPTDLRANPNATVYVPNELCDGVDNDCDGDTDEELGLGDLCERSAGVCVATGQYVCNERGQVVCSAETPATSAEVCDGVDNDCDGAIDEQVDVACSDGCRTGWRRCEAGLLGECVLDTALPELCDAEDNDCDGEVDEGFDVGQPCFVEGATGCVAEGVLACSADGAGTRCIAEEPVVQPETCNAKDDDCDGEIDEGDLCGAPWICWSGKCVLD